MQKSLVIDLTFSSATDKRAAWLVAQSRTRCWFDHSFKFDRTRALPLRATGTLLSAYAPRPDTASSTLRTVRRSETSVRSVLVGQSIPPAPSPSCTRTYFPFRRAPARPDLAPPSLPPTFPSVTSSCHAHSSPFARDICDHLARSCDDNHACTHDQGTADARNSASLWQSAYGRIALIPHSLTRFLPFLFHTSSTRTNTRSTIDTPIRASTTASLGGNKARPLQIVRMESRLVTSTSSMAAVARTKVTRRKFWLPRSAPRITKHRRKRDLLRSAVPQRRPSRLRLPRSL